MKGPRCCKLHILSAILCEEGVIVGHQCVHVSNYNDQGNDLQTGSALKQPLSVCDIGLASVNRGSYIL